MKCNLAKIGLFAGGVLFGTAGLKILSSREAKKVYTHTTAAALRAKEDIMKTVTSIKECAGDIVADAVEINEKQAAEAEVIEDCCGADAAEEDGADGCCCGCASDEETSDDAEQ